MSEPLSIDAAIAQAVADELEHAPAGAFSRLIAVERLYLSKGDLGTLKGVRVTVGPETVTTTPYDRASAGDEVSVKVVIRCKLSKADGVEFVAEIDGLRLLVQEIGRWLEGRPLAGVSAQWVSQENRPAWMPEHLENYRQFTSVITIAYRAVRDVGREISS